MLLWTDIHLSPVLVLFCYPIQSVYILMGMCVCVCVCVFVCACESVAAQKRVYLICEGDRQAK